MLRALGTVVLLLALILGLTLDARRKSRALPLRIRHNVPFCDVVFEGEKASCVVDTGSRPLLLAGGECSPSMCDNPTLLRASPPFAQLSYGSQKCDVGWLSGRVEVGDYQKPMVKAAIAHRMAGTSNLNVLGLGRGNAVGARRFSMILTDDGGELALTPSARRLLASRVEKRGIRLPLKSDSIHYLVSGRDLLFDGRPTPWTSGFVLVDSGSNVISLPSALLHNELPREIQVTLQGRMGATLSITVRTEHMDFDGGDHLLIGAMLLRNLHLDFTPNELRISSLHS